MKHKSIRTLSRMAALALALTLLASCAMAESLDTAPATEPYIELSTQYPALTVKAGDSLTFDLDLDNYSGVSQDITLSVAEIPEGWEGLDIGPKTCEQFAEVIRTAKTVVWNGPMGVFEMPNFAKGTIAVAKALAESDAISIIGGGDSAAAIEQLGFADKVTHISTGGGASLEFLEGKVLPGIAALEDK